MNKIYLLPCLLLLTCTLHAQKDTVFISNTESSEALTPTVLTAARNEVFKMQDPCRFLLKFNLVSIVPNIFTGIENYNTIGDANGIDSRELHLSGEFKLAPSFSIDAGVQTTLPNQNEQIKWFSSLTARVEPRWYYGMSKKIKNGTQADNLSGNYLSVEYAHTRYKDESLGIRNTLLINWGVQRRLFNRGYFDLGFGAGMAMTNDGPFRSGGRAFFARPRAAIGLAAALPKSGESAGSYCDVLRCFVEERRMWKVDLFNLIDFYSDYRFRAAALAPTIAFEQKIAASAWSVHTEISGLYQNARYATGLDDPNQYLYVKTYQAAIAVQPRWYFHLKRRIAQGKSGNSLSGIYLGLDSRWAYNYQPATNFIQFGTDNNHTQYWTWAPVLGWQYRFMRNGYADFNFGPGWGFKQSAVTNNSGAAKVWQKSAYATTIGGIRIGLAF